ncbi:MAG: GtrA family protein [bacterium]|nr:GtrA family protein [bacterium]MDO8742397.1 GtrA family protein [bacterium]
MTESDTYFRRWTTWLRHSTIGRRFWDKKFLHYTWIGIFVSILNIFLLWLLIDVLGIATVIASIIAVLGTFILRYVLLDSFNSF